MSQANSGIRLPSPLVALIGWIVPGAGYWVIGQTARGMIVFVTIIVLWFSGLLVAGVRVIEVPGYSSKDGHQIRMAPRQDANGKVFLAVVEPTDRDYARGSWILTSGGFMAELTNKPWYAGQVLIGPLCLWTGSRAVRLAELGADYPRPHASIETVGVLYTAIAGMLNLLVMIDAAHRAGSPRAASSGKSP